MAVKVQGTQNAQVGTLGARPAATGSKALYFATDQQGGTLYVDAALGVWTPATNALLNDPVYATHNMQPSYLKYSKAALAGVRAGTRDFRIMWAGDSIVAASSGATTPLTDNFPRRAAQILAAKTGLTARRGMVHVEEYGGVNSMWTLGADWGAWGVIGQATAVTAASGTATTLDFTPTDDSGASIQSDSFIIYIWSGGSGGGAQYAIDGGGFSTLTVPGPGYSGISAATVSAGARGTHVLHLKAAAAGNGPIILGAEAVDSQARGIRWALEGAAGSQTPASYSPGAVFGIGAQAAYAADLIGFNWGVNEYLNQTALATYQTNVQNLVPSLVALFAKKCDILWLGGVPNSSSLTIPQSSYQATIDAAAEASNFPVLHIDRQLVSYAVANAAPMSLMGDTTHPNTPGYNFVGSAVAALLATL